MPAEIGSRDPRRRFTKTEREVLYLAADARCCSCGLLLRAGWHADHVTPHSKGGATDVANGQALCANCNLTKGVHMKSTVDFTPRAWQERGHRAWVESRRSKPDFLASATPGAGKTDWSLWCARTDIDDGSAARLVVIVPTDALRQQWADAAARFGLHLMPVAVAEDYDKAGYDGCVATYQQVASGAGADLLRRAMARRSTLAILDEVHHAGDDRSWGTALQHALEPATRRLHLTGTPWRRNPSSPIPFVQYNRDGKVVVDIAYEYGTAVADGVCRRIEFHAYNGEARWVDCGKIVEAQIGAELDDEDVAAALDAALDPDNDWMPALLRSAATALDELRLEVPDAGGLVIAHRQWHAQAYANLLQKITGETPVIAISDDPEAKAKIDAFRSGRQRWLVAVKMVSEGVDVKRLAVGVYGAKTRTPMFFRQVVGRFVRTRANEEINARLYIPAIPALMEHAREIELELRHQLQAEREATEKAQREDDNGQTALELREPLSASEATFDSAIYSGQDISAELRAKAEAWCHRRGIPPQWAPNVINDVLAEERAVQIRGPRSEIEALLRVGPEKAAKPRHRQEELLRKEITTLVGKVSYRAGVEAREVNTGLLKMGFPQRKTASLEQLQAIESELLRQLNEL